MTYAVDKSDAQWRDELTPEQYAVLREAGTERAWTGELLDESRAGLYTCAACHAELFKSGTKFDSHCGWPSFDREIEGGKITTKTDRTFGMVRTEILCAKCGSHLGHLFDDGPADKGGKRYCINSACLIMEKK